MVKNLVLFFLLAAQAQPAFACPPSPPSRLYDVPQAKRTTEYATDLAALNHAQEMLWAECYEHATNDCQAQCEAGTLKSFHYVKGDVHYQYSEQERKDAAATIEATEKKWATVR